MVSALASQPRSQGFSLEGGRGGKPLPPSREKPWERGCSPPDRMVWVLALSGDIVLCFWTRPFTITVSNILLAILLYLLQALLTSKTVRYTRRRQSACS